MKIKKLFAIVLTICLVTFPASIVDASEFISSITSFTYNGYNIPTYDGDISEVINNNEPKFDDSQLNQTIYESYGNLDSLGRVTTCEANIDYTLMPTTSRGDISSIYPTGWQQKSYSFVSGNYLYNRSHLIGFQLTGENANINNLMTGTRTFNAVGMLEYENKVANYIKSDNENNVLYRITPVFQGDNLLASGVIMEAKSVDDDGKAVEFCVFIYNVERGVEIDYSTGNNKQENSNSTIGLSNSDIWLSSLNYTYNGSAIKPKETIKHSGNTLTKGTDYTVSYKNNINAGTATVYITGINNYSETVSKNFTIKKASYSPTIKSKTYSYDGKSHSISISNVKNGSTIKYKTSSSGSYSSTKPKRKSVGKTTVYYSITNPNYYAISGSKIVTIIPKATSITSIKGKSKSVALSWKKITSCTSGYQIQMSTNSNFSNAKYITISNNKSRSKTIKGLKSNKKYYIRIRTYKTITYNGKKQKLYSNWTKTKSIKTK